MPALFMTSTHPSLLAVCAPELRYQTLASGRLARYSGSPAQLHLHAQPHVRQYGSSIGLQDGGRKKSAGHWSHQPDSLHVGAAEAPGPTARRPLHLAQSQIFRQPCLLGRRGRNKNMLLAVLPLMRALRENDTDGVTARMEVYTYV